ncbi:MAG: hypothetical protein ABJO36_05075 [Litorimonas sp.]
MTKMEGKEKSQGKVRKKSFRLSMIGNWSFPSIDFSKPGQSKPLLKTINFLCKIFGKRLPVRFFAHYGTSFDASILEHLPDVQWLLVDCLQDISNSEQIFELSKLKRFSFGVYNYDNPSFLHKLNLDKLEQLSISETKKRNFDLSPLREAKQIRDLSIEGHSQNIEVIGELESLERLSLRSISKSTSLEFVSNIAELESLEIVLGGRQNIDEVFLPSLKELKVTRVRGLDDLGDLSRFPGLRSLRVADQIKLHSISFQNPNLTDLWIVNCKLLKTLTCLENLRNIKHVHCAQTSLDYEALSDLKWAKSLKSLSLYSGNEKRDAALERKIKAKGYKHFRWTFENILDW